MIASNIGKTFLKAYNKKYGTSYSARDFFIEIYHPLFYDHEKYMQWVTNSPFVQGIRTGFPLTAEMRKEKLDTLNNKIAQNNADASIAIGFPSLDTTATTSGQITNLNLPIKEEEVYQSWIGGGLGIGIQGGLSIFFNEEQLLLDLFEGWAIYRDFLNTMSSLRGNQINTWNGQWLAHRYNKKTYDPDNQTASFNPFSSKGDINEVDTQSWVSILTGIAYQFSDSQLTGYVYNLGQTNTTIGFIPFNLPHIRRPYELCRKYFNTTDVDQIKALFGTSFGFERACQMGSIGINALEPKGLREYIQNAKMPVYKKDDKTIINFNTYQIWLLAMLNNEQLWERAKEIATLLNEYSISGEKAKKDKTNNVKQLLAATNKKAFIESLTQIVGDSQINSQFDVIGKEIHLMPSDNVPYYLTLIRFQYAILNN